MWNPESRDKVHIAGLDDNGERLTDYACATIKAGLFANDMYIELVIGEEPKIIKGGVVTQIAIYDHCGHFYKAMQLDEPTEVGAKRFGPEYIKFSNTKISLRGDIEPTS